MKLKQLSVFLENQPGALSRTCQLLGRAQINIQTFALADTQQFGILRLMVQEWERAKAVLESNGCVVQVTEVLAIEVPDRPGGLAEVLQVLEHAQVNVEYMYAFTSREKEKGLLVFRFDQPDTAMSALHKAGIDVVSGDELPRRLGQR